MSKVERLMTEPSFEENCMKQRAICRLSGGTDAAVEAIKAGYLHYVGAKKVEREGFKLMEASHVVDLNYYEKTKHMSYCKMVSVLFVLLPMVSLYVLFFGFRGIINFFGSDADDFEPLEEVVDATPVVE